MLEAAEAATKSLEALVALGAALPVPLVPQEQTAKMGLLIQAVVVAAAGPMLVGVAALVVLGLLLLELCELLHRLQVRQLLQHQVATRFTHLRAAARSLIEVSYGALCKSRRRHRHTSYCS